VSGTGAGAAVSRADCPRAPRPSRRRGLSFRIRSPPANDRHHAAERPRAMRREAAHAFRAGRGAPAARGDGPNRLRQGTNVCVSKPTHCSSNDRTIGEEQQYPSDHVTHLAPKVRTILNLIVAFRCACDGHCGRALEYRRLLQGALPIIACFGTGRVEPALSRRLRAPESQSQCRAERICAIQRP
jgi:hypothetical protein